ncbi:hypothetical protein, partial [Sediminibacterium sp. C3]|uniref:hypothetical protein n=1 Tax=Sediminibacterium sp. C3 TaxID=1267211 RepID=UPI001F2BF843
TEWHMQKNSSDPLESVDELIQMILYQLKNNYTFEKNHLVLLMHDRMFESESNLKSLKKFMLQVKLYNIKAEMIDNYPNIN